MGNSNSSSKNKQNIDDLDFFPDEDPIDDFEPIDKPASPTFLKTFQKQPQLGTDDLATSGILVDMPPSDETSSAAAMSKRRIVKAGAPKAHSPVRTKDVVKKEEEEEEDPHAHNLSKVAQSDQELLEESFTKSKQERLQKMQMDHKSRRQKAIQERRQKKNPPSSSVSANPFSRFLSVFSVEPPFPSHKRPFDTEEEEEIGDISALEPKRPKLDPNYKSDDDDDDSSDDDERYQSQKFPHRVKDWLDAHLPFGWPWMAALGLAAVLMATTSHQKQQRLTSKSW